MIDEIRDHVSLYAYLLIPTMVAFICLHGAVTTITVSVGCASTGDLGPLSPRELYAAADEALYEAKKRGRDRSVRADKPRALRTATADD